MYQHRRKHDSGTLGDRLERAWAHQVQTKRTPSLSKALCSVFAFEFCTLCIIALFAETVR